MVLADVSGPPKRQGGYKNQNEGTKTGVPGPPKPERGYNKQNDGTQNWKKGTFAKTALLQNRPFVSSRPLLHKTPFLSKQGSTPTGCPLGAGPARPNPKKGAPETENPLFIGLAALRRGLGPWSQTVVSEGARPWGRDRAQNVKVGIGIGSCKLFRKIKLRRGITIS